MRRSVPEEEACGVWLDAAALKRRKVQTHLIKPGTKMLTLFPGERKSNCCQRRIPSAGIRQTSIASFFTLQPGMTNGGNQRSVSSNIENQMNKKSKKDVTQLDHLIQDLGDECMALPLATSTPAGIQVAGLSLQPLQTSGHRSMETPFLTTMLSLPQDTLVCAGESKAFTQNLESACLLDPKKGMRESPRKRKWLHGYRTNYQGKEGHIKPPWGKCHQPLDKGELERKISAKENRQAPICLQTYRESWSGENTESVKQSLRPFSVFSWESEKNDKDSWSQLFTEDSQGQRVIAHNTKAPFQDVTNTTNQDLGHILDSPQALCQDLPIQLHLQPNLLFTQDSEGNQVMRHQ
uniref:Aurora kinase A and ninein-interacting protein n=1 Tax=Castor canadensis TaxID=51338 RepID=A0A8C0X6X6_CASCN